MKDAFGRILEVRDQVAHVYGQHSLYITKNYVVKFSEKQVYLGREVDSETGAACHPHRCIKLEAI